VAGSVIYAAGQKGWAVATIPPTPASTPTRYGTHGLVLQRGGTGSIFGGGAMLIV